MPKVPSRSSLPALAWIGATTLAYLVLVVLRAQGWAHLFHWRLGR